jgi:hypothetical protein
MKNVSFPAAIVFLLLFSSCQKETENLNPTSVADGKATAQIVPLSVVIEPLDGISPDGLGAYTHNSQNVRAELQSGNTNFYFMSNTSTRSRSRSLKFPFYLPLGGLDNFWEYRIRAAFPNDLLTMGVGVANAQLGSLRVWAYQNKSSIEEFSLRYQIGESSESTSFVKVTRTSATTWTLSPEAEPSTAALKVGSGTITPKSPVPFEITLTRL